MRAEGEGAPSAAARLYTIAAGEPFLDRLAAAILNGDLPRPGGPAPDPLALPDITILLPTRRAARALQEAFLRASGRAALLLPAIRPIGEVDEEASLIAGIVNREDLAGGTDIPLAISELERRLALTELVMAWSEALRVRDDSPAALTRIAAGARSPAQAQQLAAELSRLMDMLETEKVPLSALDGIVPETYSEHWQQTLEFLKIITVMWPAHLAEMGRLSRMQRRNRLIQAEVARLAAHPPTAPLIVAGVTGSVPATADLMGVVARLEQGAIVLPGLEPIADETTAKSILSSPEHPQHGLAKLLTAVRAAHRDVQALPGGRLHPLISARMGFLGEAMRPAATTTAWHAYARDADSVAIAAALNGVSLIEAPSAQDEAEAVALILREAAETPGRTAALVSPDRLLARRVGVRLESWGIRVDDSAGRPFAKTVPGTFLDLVIEAASTHFSPAALVALLKHPLLRLGLPVGDVRRAARTLEIAAFRTAYLGRGLGGVEDALEKAAADSVKGGARRERAVRRLGDSSWAAARDLVQRLQEAYAPLIALYADDTRHPLRDLAKAHVEVAEALARLADESAAPSTAVPGLVPGTHTPEPRELGDDRAPSAASGVMGPGHKAQGGGDGTTASPLYEQEAGKAAADIFTGLLAEGLRAPKIEAADYADFYRSLVAGETVRVRVPVHPRLFIWGPLEARLQQADVVILGSLNDGTWPEAADPGPWLNRPMRAGLKLPAPEEEIGRAAHDFVSLMGAARVYLTRAEKVDGVPTVPSRWLMRMRALLGGMGLTEALKSDRPWLGWARARDRAERSPPLGVPSPKPPLALRPRRMSVSGVETWIANPYAIYARHVLELEPMAPLGQQPDAALRGSIVHEALGRFAARHPEKLPVDPNAELMAIVADVIGGYTRHPRVAAFWLPRLARFAHWFAATEQGRRTGITHVLSEVTGSLVLESQGGPFMLTARADRVDIGGNGLVIADYKTGSNLAGLASRAAKGVAPQLLLEAAIAAAGGFERLPASPIAALKYISASGGEPAGDEVTVKTDDIARLAADARAGLANLIALYDEETTPYRAVRRAGFSYDYDEFAHLARVKEWSIEAEDGEGEAA